LNVIIIGTDTLRQDHLGCYGYERSTSPNIDRLARRGVLFENAVSQSPWTTPSFATVFTSLYPTQHGAGSLYSRLRTESTSLAEVLVQHGYTTGAIINALAMSPQFGLDRGFQDYDMTASMGTRVADGTTTDALNWIELHRDNPFFIFVHYYDPHLPYSPPAPFDDVFDSDYDGTIGNSFGLEDFPYARVSKFETLEKLTESDWNRIVSLYDGEIAFMDEAIGDLLEGVEDLGLSDNTLIVFLSDHGEEFLDHGGLTHGHTLYEELIKVPLIFSFPPALAEGIRIASQVRLLDVATTIMDLLGIKPDVHVEGISLKPYLTSSDKIRPPKARLTPPDVAFAEALRSGPERKAIMAYPWKLIYNTKTEEEKLFNLQSDPGERVDLIDQEHQPRLALEDLLTNTLFGISDTWYIEIAPGEDSHVFDLEIALEGRAASDRIFYYKILDADHRVRNPRLLSSARVNDKTLRLTGLSPEEPLILAFKTRPAQAPINFDLQIDGEPAIAETFLGKSGTNPEMMPFVQKGKTRAVTEGAPTYTPAAPVFSVWHTTTEFRSENRIKLDEQMEKGFRAIGYIQ
jgi:arylsulfatase A-like enzyme